MNYFLTVFAILAIGASGFALPLRAEPDRLGTLPLAGPIAISIDDLAPTIHNRKAFKDSQVPERVKNLHGKRVRLIGVMTPTFKETGIEEFVFNGDTRRKFHHINSDMNLIPVEYFVPVEMRKGTTTSYTHKSIEIEGRLIIRPDFVEGELSILYWIEDATVRPGQRQKGFKQSTGNGC